MTDAKQAATGRWEWLLGEFGIDPKYLKNKHGPCPICGGEDRFRFDNKDGRGTWFCNSCGAGDGFDLVMQVTGMGFQDVAKRVESLAGQAPEKKRDFTKPLPVQKRKMLLNRTWKKCTGEVHLEYLKNRGLVDTIDFLTSDVRSCWQLYYQDNETFPAMVCMVRDPKGRPVSLHRTFLFPNGSRQKKMMPPLGELKGAAIHLIEPEKADVLVVGEGVESALSAWLMVVGRHDWNYSWERVACWATISSFGMENVEIQVQRPDSSRRIAHLIVAGDSDKNFVGQAAAYKLASRYAKGKNVIDQVTVYRPGTLGQDANDVYCGSDWDAMMKESKA